MARFGSVLLRESHGACSQGPSTYIKVERDAEAAVTRHDGTQPLAAFVITRDGRIGVQKLDDIEGNAAFKRLSSVVMNYYRANLEGTEAQRNLTGTTLMTSLDHITSSDDGSDARGSSRGFAHEAEQSSRWRGRSTRRSMRCRAPVRDLYDILADPCIQDEAQITDDGTTPPELQSQQFSVADSDKVKAYLYNGFEKLQQLSAKHIAKVWIKGICPRKQANFPYQNKQKEEECGGPDIPEWWPNQALCPWKEPDHIRKEERTELLIHILRLRPSSKELESMNHGKCELTDNQAFESWTAFLRSLASPSCTNDVRPFDKVARKKRHDILRGIYDVAEKEQNFLDGNGPPSVIYWQDDAKAVSRRRKKRAVSVTSSTATEGQGIVPRPSSTSRGRRAMKRRRCRSPVPSPATMLRPQVRQLSFNPVKEQETSENDQSSPVVATAALIDDPAIQADLMVPDAKPLTREHATPLTVPQSSSVYSTAASWQAAHYDPPVQDWQAMIASPNTSSGSSVTAGEPVTGYRSYQKDTAQQSMHRDRDHYYGYQGQQSLAQSQDFRIFQAQHIPQPHFATVPNTPTESHSGFMWPVYDHQTTTQSPVTPMTGFNLAHAQDASAPAPAPAYLFDPTARPRPFQTPTTHYLDQHQLQPQLVAPADLHQQVNCMHGLPDPALPYAGHSATVPASPYPNMHDYYFTPPQWPSESHLERGFTGHSSGVGGGQPT